MPIAAIKKARSIALAFTSMVLIAIAIDARAITVLGARSCGTWIESRTDNSSGKSWASLASESWLVGYLSGLAGGIDKDFLKGTDAPSIFLWVDNYCRSNPLKAIDDAGIALALELVKQKRL